MFVDLPDGFYYEGKLQVTKALLDASGNPKNSSSVFYAGVFLDKECTTLATEKVSRPVVELDLAGGSEVTEEVVVFLLTGEEETTLYVTETDAAGKPVEGSQTFRYDVDVEGGKATVTTGAPAKVRITNTEWAANVTPTATPTPTARPTTSVTPTPTARPTGTVTPTPTKTPGGAGGSNSNNNGSSSGSSGSSGSNGGYSNGSGTQIISQTQPGTAGGYVQQPAVATGDDAPVTLYVMMLAIAAAAVIMLAFKKRRRSAEQE